MTLLRDRWRSRQLVGDSKHALIVRLRRGHFHAGFHPGNRIDDGTTPFNGSLILPPLIYGSHRITDCFKKTWTADSPWRVLPQVQSVKWSRSFDVQTGGERGAATATILMDNINFTEVTGPAGVYHQIDRGYYSPARGLAVGPRPNLWPDHANDWQNALNAGWQVEVWEGYGTGADIQLRDTPDSVYNSYAPASGALSRTFTGIITVCEQESNPDTITITAQDFTVFLTDERLAGWNAALEIPHPVTFANRKTSQGELAVSGPYAVSDGTVQGSGKWLSDGHPTANPSPLPFIDIQLQAGHYEEIFVALSAQLTMYVSLYLGGSGQMDNGTTALAAGWVPLTGPGTGDINGYPYMRVVTVRASPATRWNLGHSFDVPSGSYVRLTFGNLYAGGDGQYHAATNVVTAYRMTGAATSSDATPPHSDAPGGGALSVSPGHGWILCEDAIDVVRMILIWCGFHEWQLENFGWSLWQPRLYGIDKHHMDVITDMLQQGAFVFHLAPPTLDDRSIGVPHFEHVSMLDPPYAGMLEVRDTDLIEAVSVKWDLSNLPDEVRYAGAITAHGDTLRNFGAEGRVKRYRGAYYPPWSSSWVGVSTTLVDPPNVGPHGPIYVGQRSVPRDGSVNRQFTETMGATVQAQLNSDEECLMACVIAAIDYAINMASVQFQIPGVAPLNLNDQIALVDEASSTNSRVWITSIESEHVTGGGEQPGYWRMTVGGALMDTQDMQLIKMDYDTAYVMAQKTRAHSSGAVAL